MALTATPKTKRVRQAVDTIDVDGTPTKKTACKHNGNDKCAVSLAMADSTANEQEMETSKDPELTW